MSNWGLADSFPCRSPNIFQVNCFFNGRDSPFLVRSSHWVSLVAFFCPDSRVAPKIPAKVHWSLPTRGNLGISGKQFKKLMPNFGTWICSPSRFEYRQGSLTSVMAEMCTSQVSLVKNQVNAAFLVNSTAQKLVVGTGLFDRTRGCQQTGSMQLHVKRSVVLALILLRGVEFLLSY